MKTMLFRRHQRAPVLWGGVVAIPSLSLYPPLKFTYIADAPYVRILFECTAYGMEAPSRACPGEAEEVIASLANLFLSVKFSQKYTSESPKCWAMRSSSDDAAIDCRAGGGARRSAPSIPNRLASWVFL
jgi:hypothetical protein